MIKIYFSVVQYVKAVIWYPITHTSQASARWAHQECYRIAQENLIQRIWIQAEERMSPKSLRKLKGHSHLIIYYTNCQQIWKNEWICTHCREYIVVFYFRHGVIRPAHIQTGPEANQCECSAIVLQPLLFEIALGIFGLRQTDGTLMPHPAFTIKSEPSTYQRAYHMRYRRGP